MIRWARELVVDRNVLVYAPPLHDLIGPRLGPIRIFADQEELWRAVSVQCSVFSVQRPMGKAQVRVFPMGGLTYAC